MDDLSNTANTATSNAHQAATTQSPAQRDAQGRFVKGSHGWPGNPFARQTAKLRQAALEAVSAEDMRAAMNALKEKAAKGDVAAIRLLLSYTVGKPTEAVDPDTLDQHEMQTMVNNHVRSAASAVHVIEGMPLDALLLMLRAALPELFKSKLQKCKEVLTAPPAEEDDDDDDLDFEEDAVDAASGPANVGAEDAHARNDNIPAWMYEMVNANRAVPPAEITEKAQHARDKRGQQERALKDIQTKLDRLNEMKTHRCDGEEQENGGQRINGEVLQSLTDRMTGNVPPAEDETPPSTNGRNGSVKI